MKRMTKHAVQTRIDATAALVSGLSRAQRLGLTKDPDIAIVLRIELEAAGFALIRRPNSRTN